MIDIEKLAEDVQILQDRIVTLAEIVQQHVEHTTKLALVLGDLGRAIGADNE